MKEVVLLGAGASKEAEIPTSFEMVNKLVGIMTDNDDSNDRLFLHAIRFATAALVLYDIALEPERADNNVDIERLFDTLEMLGRRDRLEVTPFVSAWHPALDEICLPQKDISANMLRDLLDAIEWGITERNNPDTQSTSEEIDQRFAESFKIAANIATGNYPKQWVFQQTLKRMTQMLWELLWITEEKKIEHLKPLLRYCEKSNSNTLVATLNYDNTIEFCAEKLGFLYSLGMEAWATTGYVAHEPGRIKILKLHGSIDWEIVKQEGSYQKPIPDELVRQKQILDPQNDFGFQPAIVFGGQNKLTAEGPFLELFRCLYSELYIADRLTVIGYSFRDKHINKLLRQWINDVDRKVRIINGENFTLAELSKKLGADESHLDGRVEIISQYAGAGIEQLYGDNS
jgi:hypothetical protein